LRLRTERLEAVAELSASLAHEIKNPLATIRSSVEQLGVSERSNDDERILVNLVVRESDRLSRLLTEFLDFSRVRVTNCRTIKLSEVVKDAVVVVKQHPDCTDGVVIEVDVQPVSVEGDEDLLHRVVVNLVLNAVQVCNGKCRIVVELREADASELPREFRLETGVLLKVTDSGPGIPSHLRDRLFEPFVTDRDGGSGLGLAIVQRAVQAHRGVIWTDSDPTTFTVVLPSKRTAEVNS
jgi:two-component system sensor histidine kinase PilS (NtrC family)